jgi:hypothetical protein
VKESTRWKWALATLALWIALYLCACVPVTIRPERDADGLPVATPVTVVGSITPEGVLVPVYPVSNRAPSPPPSVPWETILQVVLGAAGVAGGGWGLVASRLAAKAKTALQITCDLADRNAETNDPLEIERNKMIAQHQQEAMGVRGIVQAVRKRARKPVA